MFENIHPYFVSQLDHRERVRRGVVVRRSRRLGRRDTTGRSGRPAPGVAE